MINDKRKRRAAAMYQRAGSLNRKKRYSKAVKIYRQLIEVYSDLFDKWDLLFRTGYCYTWTEDYAQAIRFLEAAYDEIPLDTHEVGRPLLLDYLAIAHLFSGNYEKAYRYAEEAERFAHHYEVPDRQFERFDHRALVGRVNLYLRKPMEALKQFSRLTELIPDTGDEEHYENIVNFETGRALFYLEEFQRALTFLSQVNPSKLSAAYRPSFHSVMQQLSVHLKDYRKSLEHFEHLSGLDAFEEFGSLAHHFAGRAYCSLDDKDRASTHFELSKNYPPAEDWLEESNKAYLKALAEAEQ